MGASKGLGHVRALRAVVEKVEGEKRGWRDAEKFTKALKGKRTGVGI